MPVPLSTQDTRLRLSCGVRWSVGRQRPFRETMIFGMRSTTMNAEFDLPKSLARAPASSRTRSTSLRCSRISGSRSSMALGSFLIVRLESRQRKPDVLLPYLLDEGILKLVWEEGIPMFFPLVFSQLRINLDALAQLLLQVWPPQECVDARCCTPHLAMELIGRNKTMQNGA